jgi:hypothetical protein
MAGEAMIEHAQLPPKLLREAADEDKLSSFPTLKN